MGLEYTEELEVFDLDNEKVKRGTLFITERTSGNSSAYSWKWEHGPAGFDNGGFQWRQQFLILNSEVTQSFVWAVVNRRWQSGSVVPKPKPWFAENDRIIVTYEDEPPYPTYSAKRRR